MSKRKYKTPAERIAEADRLKVNTIVAETLKALDNEGKAAGWQTRAEELIVKAEGARKAAVTTLLGIGLTEEQARDLLYGDTGRQWVVDTFDSLGVPEEVLIAKGLLPGDLLPPKEV